LILLDTSGLLCSFDAADPRHGDAVTLLQAASARLTHSYVLAEFVPLCQSRRLNRTLALAFIEALMSNPLVEVVWVDEAIHRAALAMLRAQIDKNYSLCDAVSFQLMQERGILESLTTDHHFEQAGFQRLLR
jgi:predicted nucleic acid-binding protein